MTSFVFWMVELTGEAMNELKERNRRQAVL